MFYAPFGVAGSCYEFVIAGRKCFAGYDLDVATFSAGGWLGGSITEIAIVRTWWFLGIRRSAPVTTIRLASAPVRVDIRIR